MIIHVHMFYAWVVFRAGVPSPLLDLDAYTHAAFVDEKGKMQDLRFPAGGASLCRLYVVLCGSMWFCGYMR